MGALREANIVSLPSTTNTTISSVISTTIATITTADVVLISELRGFVNETYIYRWWTYYVCMYVCMYVWAIPCKLVLTI